LTDEPYQFFNHTITLEEDTAVAINTFHGKYIFRAPEEVNGIQTSSIELYNHPSSDDIEEKYTINQIEMMYHNPPLNLIKIDEFYPYDPELGGGFNNTEDTAWSGSVSYTEMYGWIPFGSYVLEYSNQRKEHHDPSDEYLIRGYLNYGVGGDIPYAPYERIMVQEEQDSLYGGLKQNPHRNPPFVSNAITTPDYRYLNPPLTSSHPMDEPIISELTTPYYHTWIVNNRKYFFSGNDIRYIVEPRIGIRGFYPIQEKIFMVRGTPPILILRDSLWSGMGLIFRRFFEKGAWTSYRNPMVKYIYDQTDTTIDFSRNTLTITDEPYLYHNGYYQIMTDHNNNVIVLAGGSIRYVLTDDYILHYDNLTLIERWDHDNLTVYYGTVEHFVISCLQPIEPDPDQSTDSNVEYQLMNSQLGYQNTFGEQIRGRVATRENHDLTDKEINDLYHYKPANNQDWVKYPKPSKGNRNKK
jgi:hypothetical protein